MYRTLSATLVLLIVLSACVAPTSAPSPTSAVILPTLIPTETPTPTLYVQPGMYLLKDHCATFLVKRSEDVTGNVDMCVTSVAVEADGKMRFNVSWTAHAAPSYAVSVFKASDVADTGVTLTDNMGNRYDHVDVGGAAAYDVIYSQEGETREGWYLFQPAKAGATTFAFHDDSHQVVVKDIQLVQPADFTVLSTKLRTKDLISDPVTLRLYASVPGDGGIYANSVVSIDIANGAVIGAIPVGPEPGKLAISDDDRYLYVGLDGADAIRRVDLDSQMADITIGLPPNTVCRGQPGRFAKDIVVLKGHPKTIAVSISSPRCGEPEGVAIFDDDVQRSVMVLPDILSWTLSRVK